MRAEERSSIKSSLTRRDAALVALLTAASFAVYLRLDDVSDPRRFVLSLAGVGLLFAAPSERPLRLALVLPATALLSWVGRMVADGSGGAGLWFGCSVAGALLVVRIGGRAARYYLPRAGSEEGLAQQGSIRRNLQAAFVLFVVVFVADGLGGRSEALDVARAFVLSASAALFLRFLLLQAKYLKLSPRALDVSGLVPAQRWPFLVLMAVVVTGVPARVVPQGSDGTVLLSAALVLVLSALVATLALPRLGWTRSSVRRAAFGIGVGLAVAVAAVAVELEGFGPSRFTAFSTLCSLALVVAPFVHATTGLFSDYPRLATLVAQPLVSVMIYPVSVVNGWRWALASTGFLFAFAVLTLVYHLTVVLRERRPGGAYLAASLGVLILGFVLNGSGGSASGAVWKIALVALGFALWAFDLYDRAGQLARGSAR